MPIIPAGTFDTIEANISSLLVAFSAAQAVMDPTVAFKVFRRRVRPLADTEMPAVNVWLASADDVDGSGGRSSHTESVTFNVDLHARGAAGTLPSDEAAMARLYYLREQVKYALYALAQADFGLAPGLIARKHWPSYQTVVERQPETEEQTIFGRWTVTVEYVWQAADAQIEALTQLVATISIAPDAPDGGVDISYGD